ncbi:hypothetical protein WN943_018173 [Citrus x changshan-huyou]
MDDRIGELPDDILISILSRLTIDEAARASVLSYRWRYSWRFFTSDYDVDSWIHQRLELDFNESKKGGRELHTFSQYSDTSSFSSLMSLRLIDVDIPEETLHYLLYYCPLLGELRPKVAERLMRIRVSGRSLNLKCLEDDPHLNLRGVSFIGFEGREVDVEFLKDLLENAVRLEKMILNIVGILGNNMMKGTATYICKGHRLAKV